MLNGHIDVVSPGEVLKWKYPPWSGAVADGRVHGRGSADMKGGLVCALYAIKAVIDSGFSLKGKVLLSSVIGEEDGGIGALDLILHGYHADAAIIPEPSDLDAVPAHAGVMAFRVTVQGKASHASLRDEGVNAIEKAYSVTRSIEKIRVASHCPY